MKTVRSAVAVLLATAAVLAQPADAAVFSFDNTGVTLPSAACPAPPALPLGCDITALGGAFVTSGDVFGPWNFASVFSIGAPLSATTFAMSGNFLFDDTSAANNDFFGTLSGIFDVTTFSTAIDYLITGGLGEFLNATGFGSGVVFITPQLDGPPTYRESGRMVIPEPGPLALLAAALLAVFGITRHRAVARAR